MTTFKQKLTTKIKGIFQNYSHHKLVIGFILLIPILIGVFVLFKYFAPLGLVVSYQFNIADNAELFGRVRNLDRSARVVFTENGLRVEDKFDLTKQRTEFSIAPITNDLNMLKFDFNISKIPSQNLILEVRDFVNNKTDSFVIDSKVISELGTPTYEYNGNQVWAINPELQTSANLISRINELTSSRGDINVCTLGNSVFFEPRFENAVTYPEPVAYNPVLRGTHKLSVFVASDGILTFSFDKQELNWYEGSDEMVVKLTHDGKLVRQDSIADDGVFDGKFGRPAGIPQSYEINLSNLDPGVYDLEFNSNEDVFISNIRSRNSKLVVSKDLFLANNSLYGFRTDPVTLFSYSPRLFVTSYHDTVDQAITINDVETTLDQFQNSQAIELSSDLLNKITFTENDVRISAFDYFGFSADSYFKPNIANQIDCSNFDSTVVKKQDLLVIKSIATKDGNDYSLEIPFSQNYIGPEGKIYFYLYRPSLDDSQKVELNSMQIEMIRP